MRLTGALSDWVSAKDVILEMLRRHGVAGGVGKIIEYDGPGLACLSAMDRHVIANMGAELGATTSVFPADHAVRRFLASQGRGDDWRELSADADATYDEHDEIDLSTLEPLIACPRSPDNAVPVREVAGREIYQAYIGSSANPALRDFAIAALMVDGRQVHEAVSFDINPTSRQILENLTQMGLLAKLIRAGGPPASGWLQRLHRHGTSSRHGPHQRAHGAANFLGRSGTPEDHVYLCSPETAAAAALTGVITDPRTLHMACPRVEEPNRLIINTEMLIPPAPAGEHVELVKGPNIQSLPPL